MLKVFFVLMLCVSIQAFANPIAIMGDSGEAGSEMNALKESVLNEQALSILMPGDNLYKGTYASVWNGWKKSGFNFDIVAIGNHNGGYKNEIEYFNMPAEYYSVKKDGARFIVLNSDNERNVTEQMTWLKNELDQANENLIFITFHHPTFTITKSHTWTEKKIFQLQMRQVLKQYSSKISALILGHDHVSEFMYFGATPVIVAGSGREVRNEKPVSFTDDGFLVETQFMAPRTQHWALMEIETGATEARVTFIRVSDNKKICGAFFKRSEMQLDGDCPKN